jgi:hypothetical protein
LESPKEQKQRIATAEHSDGAGDAGEHDVVEEGFDAELQVFVGEVILSVRNVVPTLTSSKR